MRGRAGAHAHRSRGAGPTSPRSWQLQSPLTHHLLSSYLGKVLIYTINATKVPQSWFLGRSHTQQAAECGRLRSPIRRRARYRLAQLVIQVPKQKPQTLHFHPNLHSVLLLSPSSSGGRGAHVHPRPSPCSDRWRIRQRRTHCRHLCRR